MKDNVLKKEEFIGIIKSLVAEQVEAYVREHEIKAKEFSLLERIIRVEEELKAQREIIASLQREMGARFEAIEKRFETMNKAMEKRFETMNKAMEKRFETMNKAMEKRFEAVEKRFEAVEKRFETVDKRFESVEKRLSFLQWFMAGGFTFISVLITIINFLK